MAGGLLASIHNKPAQSYAQETSDVEAEDKKIPQQKDRVFDLVRPLLLDNFPALHAWSSVLFFFSKLKIAQYFLVCVDAWFSSPRLSAFLSSKSDPTNHSFVGRR